MDVTAVRTATADAGRQGAALSELEGEILRLLLTGATNKFAAARLGVSVRTVERQRAGALRKLGVRTLVEAAALLAPAGSADSDDRAAFPRIAATGEMAAGRLPAEAFELAFRAASVGMVIAGPDGRFWAANESFCRLLGRSESELVSETIEAVTCPDDRENDAQRNRRFFSGTCPAIHAPKRYIRPDGAIVSVHLTAGVVRGPDGAPLFGIGTVIPE
jgi:PAS domain S-box-containing protein